MIPKPLLPFFVLLLVAFGLPAHPQNRPEIDFDKARTLLQRQRSGETLTQEESAYLEKAKALRRERMPNQPGRATRPAANQRSAPERLIPLTDFAADDRYEGQEGGLYGGGNNAPPEALRKLAEEHLAEIRPLDDAGNHAPDGKIVFISISMSNATQEFSRFKQLADQSDRKSPSTIVVDCAQGGQAMAEWVSSAARPWQVALQRLEAAGVAPPQVQVAWVKLANKAPGGSLEEHSRKLEEDTLRVLQNAKAKFPNLRIAYLGSRIWGGNARSNLNPEPYAYESAFPIRWLIERQTKGDPELSPEKAPLLLWGPYLWAEGEKGRQADDLVWLPEDFAADGVHPSPAGREKVARLLLDFVTADPLASPWFARK